MKSVLPSREIRLDEKSAVKKVPIHSSPAWLYFLDMVPSSYDAWQIPDLYDMCRRAKFIYHVAYVGLVGYVRFENLCPSWHYAALYAFSEVGVPESVSECYENGHHITLNDNDIQHWLHIVALRSFSTCYLSLFPL